MTTVTYKATFANGTTITRNNHTGRVYTFAWIARTSTYNQARWGFAVDRKTAERSARSTFPTKMFDNVTIEIVPAEVVA